MRLPFALPILAALAAPAAAEPIEALTGDGRYQLMEINDRIVRLDTETGGFDLCLMEAGVWSCTVAKDERAALEARIAVLARRVEALEKAARQDAVAASEPASPVAAEAPPVATGAPLVLVETGEQEGVTRRVLRHITGLMPSIGW